MSQSTAVDLVRQKHFGHYEIVEKLGRGGMGVVYRARDLTLLRWVAIKVLRGPADVRPEQLLRFQQEARAASALNHPNIVTVHEIGDVDGIGYIAMELVEGRTLRDILLSGPLLTRRALQLAAQAAHGLAQAHAAGIVHRDLKPENIMVTDDGRVKILDFGLAKMMERPGDEDGETGPLQTPGTEPGVVLGTVGYMSPEQALGQPLDFRSDQFSCGAILYEMATGIPAFRRPSRTQTLSAIIEAEPDPIARLNPQVPAPLRWIIDRCLEKDPADRYGSTRDLARDLESVLEHLSEVSPAAVAGARQRQRRQWTRRKTSRRMVIAAAGAALVATIAAGAWFVRSRAAVAPARSERTAVGIPIRRSVAVLGFKNLSGDVHADWLSPVLAEWLTTELAAGGRLRTIPGENVGRMKMELNLSDAESLARDTLARVGKNLGTDMVLLGSYVMLPGDQVRLDLRLQDVAAGETVKALAETGTLTGLVELVTKAGSALRRSIGVEEPPRTESVGLAAGAPSNLEAQRLYGEGMARLRMLDGLAARDLLIKAVAADPNSSMAHLALADAWTMLGYDAKAREEAQRAFDLSGNLAREQRMVVEGRYRDTAGEWDKAIEIYRGLLAFFPDNLEYGLRLADTQSAAGKGQDALATLAQLRRRAPSASDDPRIDLTEAIVAQSLGNFHLQQVAASQAAKKGKDKGALLLVAGARVREAYALDRLGDIATAATAAEEARRIYAEAGDQKGLASALSSIGTFSHYRGDLETAKRNREECLEIYRRIGYRSGVVAAEHNLGLVLWEQGDLAGARRLLQDAYAGGLELHDQPGTAIELADMAVLFHDSGDLPRARHLAEQALAISRDIHNPTAEAMALLGLGTVLHSEGQLGPAAEKYRSALAILREQGTRDSVADTLFQIGQLSAAVGDLVQARRDHEEALAIRSGMHANFAMAKSNWALGRLALDEGDSARAEPLFTAASVVFTAQKTVDWQALTEAALAEGLLDGKEPTRAVPAAGRATALATRSQSPQTRLAVTGIAARVNAANGRPTEATQALAAAIDEARRLHLLGAEFELRLARAGIEGASERTAELVRDAQAKGFGLVASKAGQLLRPAEREGRRGS